MCFTTPEAFRPVIHKILGTIKHHIAQLPPSDALSSILDLIPAQLVSVSLVRFRFEGRPT